MSRTIMLGTRGSPLALAQSEYVRALLREANPGLQIETTIIQTKGDLVLDRALSRIGDKGLFVTEIEDALLHGRIDLAVHSCKDLPSVTPDGLVLAAFPARADARDALVSRHGLTLDQLPRGARVGTSSLRRACQLQAYRPDIEIVNIRGNVDTRLRKAMTDDYDAIVLAVAGLQRLNLLDRVTEFLDPSLMLPAVAQGTLAIECRADDPGLRELLGTLDDPATRLVTTAERALLRRLEGGCQVPIAAYATTAGATAAPDGWHVHLRGLVGTPDGAHVVRGAMGDTGASAEELGTRLAEELLERGADAILSRLSRVVPAVEAPEQV